VVWANAVLLGEIRMPFEGDAARHEKFVLDGVTYEIHVSADCGRFNASWKCMNGCGPGKSTFWGDSVKEAIEQARAVLMDHHARIHRAG
jgi:hypothetical protein